MNSRFAYSIGFHPWEDAAGNPRFAEKFRDLLRREEEGGSAPFGRALDVGTGSGIWGLDLAKRGWQVTGIDIVDKVLSRARQRVVELGIDMRVTYGDVTNLAGADVGSGFRLILDTGTFHDFDEAHRLAMGREMTRIAAEDATLFLLVWPRRRRPLIRGANEEDVARAFPGWTITDVEPSYFVLPKPLELLLRPDEHWYRLRRRQ